jgi:hypothetical protein
LRELAASGAQLERLAKVFGLFQADGAVTINVVPAALDRLDAVFAKWKPTDLEAFSRAYVGPEALAQAAEEYAAKSPWNEKNVTR